MSSVSQLCLVGSSLGIIIVLIRVIVPQSFDVISKCFLQSLKGLGFLCMVTLSPSYSASTPRLTFVDEGQNKKDNKGKNKKLFHDPMFTKPLLNLCVVGFLRLQVTQ